MSLIGRAQAEHGGTYALHGRSVRCTLPRRFVPPLVVILLGSAASLPAQASPPAPQRLQLMIERTTDGVASFAFAADITPGDDPAFSAVLATRVDGVGDVGRVFPLGASSHNNAQEPAVHTASVDTTSCGIGVCRTGKTLLTQENVWSPPRADDGESPNRVLILLEGERITMDFQGDGWRLRRVPHAYRRVDSLTNPGSSGVQNLNHGVHVLQHAALPGGKRGSIAVGIPPCSTSTSGVVPRGVGSIELRGGGSTQTVVCPRDRHLLGLASTGPANWVLEGMVAGGNEFRETQLLVVDLPPRWRRPY